MAFLSAEGVASLSLFLFFFSPSLPPSLPPTPPLSRSSSLEGAWARALSLSGRYICHDVSPNGAAVLVAETDGGDADGGSRRVPGLGRTAGVGVGGSKVGSLSHICQVGLCWVLCFVGHDYLSMRGTNLAVCVRVVGDI